MDTSKSNAYAERVADLLRASGAADSWQTATNDPWCSVNRSGHQLRAQGWKLHLSATVGSADDVLTAAVPVLLESGATFKLAKDATALATLNSARAPRPSAGKFVTVYPDRDEDLPALAEALHAATAGFTGPRILSDKPYRQDSIVHYRYGGFVARKVLSNDGFYRDVIADPDGGLVDDKREARYAPPAWATSPFPADPPRAPRASILLADRFAVRQAIRHANKGGVYRATDQQTGAEVVLKEARPHVQTTLQGRDVRDVLRAEAQLLRALAPTGLAPAFVTEFEHGGHLFLAEELVPGIPLRRWVLERVRRIGPRRHVPTSLSMVAALAGLLEQVHAAGVILRDFNPNNIMVGPDGTLRLIDLECAVLPAQQTGEPLAGGTPAYGAPEQFAGATPDFSADLFSLGATLHFVLLGADPYFAEGDDRPWNERLAGVFEPCATELGVPPDLRALVLDLMAEDPAVRSSLADVRATLAGRSIQPFATQPALLADPDRDQAIDDIVSHLLDTRIEGGDAFWPLAPTALTNDPISLQHGAAGVLGVLALHRTLTGDERTAELMTAAAGWISERLQREPERAPGLYFGAAGALWALHSAGVALGEDKLVDRALELAGELPTSWPNPDLTHGSAGIGLTFLRMARVSRDESFLRRADRIAAELVGSAQDTDDGLFWVPPTSFSSIFAGQRSYGFAHGTAGVGYFLLEHAQATGRQDSADLAVRAGESLLAPASAQEGSLRWVSEPGATGEMAYWCHGSSGIGTFLTRLYEVTGDDRFRAAAEGAARAVVEHAWGIPLGQCHGVAGNAEFLLDLAAVLDDPSYVRHAETLGQALYAQRIQRAGRVQFPGEEGTVIAEWASGMAGILAFLLRLRHGSPRPWMVSA